MGANATRLEIKHTAVNVSRDIMESTAKKVKISLTFHRSFIGDYIHHILEKIKVSHAA